MLPNFTSHLIYLKSVQELIRLYQNKQKDKKGEYAPTFVAGYCHRDTVDIPMALGILRKVAADLCMALCVWSSYAANLRTQSTDPRARITDFPPADHWKPSGSPKNLHSLERLDETLL